MLERMGLDPAMVDGIISSGELTWRHLQRRDHPWFARIDADRPLRAFHIGPERDRSVIEDGVAEAVADPAAADLLLNTGPDPERGSQDAEAYRPALLAAAAHRLPMVCVNPDRAVMVGGERLICAGALADIYLELGGAVLEIGKPDRAVYPPVMELLGLTDRRRLLAIGDTPHTDLAGAEAAGIDSLWALTGLTADAHGPDPAPALLDRVAAAEHVHPIAALRSLRW
jgi:HAD superfamily hydrolase (TIGR01459 family)